MKGHIMKTLSHLSAVPFANLVSVPIMSERSTMCIDLHINGVKCTKMKQCSYKHTLREIDKTILTFTLVRHRIVFKETLINACMMVVVAKQ